MPRPTEGLVWPRIPLSEIAAAQADANQALSDAADAQADATAALDTLDVLELVDLADVNVISPSDADVLTWDAGTSRWVAAPAGAPSIDLDDLGDVNAPTPDVDDVLTWDGTEWVAAPASGGGGGGGSLVSGFAFGYEADAGITVSDGNPVLNWDDSSANDYDMVATNGPTYRAADASDGLPYLEFDGSNDVMEAIRSAGLYTGQEITIFAVARAPVNGATNGIFAFSESGENMSSGHRQWLQVNTSGVMTLGFNAVGFSFGSDLLNSTQWTVVAFRAKVVMGRAIVTYIQGGNFANKDQNATSFTAQDWDRIRLGAQYNNFGAAGNFARCDIRAFYVYESGLSDADVGSMVRYLRTKWKADVMALPM